MAPNDAPPLASSPDVVAAAHALYPLVLASRDEAERIRHLPPAVAAQFAANGLFQMYLPRAMGGAERSPLEVFHVVETISRADGSAGWCVTVANAISAFMGWLTPEAGRQLAGTPANIRVAGSLRSLGHAKVVDGGYRLSGRWNFASGIDHATVLYCSATVTDGDTPRKTASGAPEVRAMWIPADQATIIDAWSVVGMRGTGSQDFAVEDVFVPEIHSSDLSAPPLEKGPLYNPRTMFTATWTGTAANALGIARGAIDAFVDLASREASTASSVLLRDRAHAQARLGEAEAIVNAARAYLLDAVSKAWAATCAGDTDLDRPIAQARLAIVHAMHEAVRAVDLVFHAAGTNAVYTRSPLERYFRDVHVAVQHRAGLPGHFESAGKVLLGLRPADIGW